MRLSLTPSQALFLARYASGATLDEIARETFRSMRAIERMSHGVRKQLNVETLAQACLVAHSLGYISLPDENGIVHAHSPFTEES